MSESNSTTMQEVIKEQTNIVGLFIANLALNDETENWISENYQQEKMEAIGLPSTGSVKTYNFSEKQVGVTRGLHAEPWDKFISVSKGTIFGVYLDLRRGKNFGHIVTAEIDPGKVVFVPRGVANGYQTLENSVNHNSYTVTENYPIEHTHLCVNAFDKNLAINWPIPQEKAIVLKTESLYPTLGQLMIELTNKKQ